MTTVHHGDETLKLSTLVNPTHLSEMEMPSKSAS